MAIPRKKLKKDLDKTFSEYIRERDDYVCITCGATRDNKVIQCGHLFSATKNSTRWDEKNAHAQCRGCNFKHEHDFERYRRRWVAQHGESEYDLLYAKWCQSTKFGLGDLRMMIKHFKDKLDKLKKEKEKKS